MSLTWKLNRIRAMGVPELAFRVGRWIYQKLERWRIARGWMPTPAGPVRPGTGLFRMSGDWIEHWNRNYGLNKPTLSEIAAGRLSFFGCEPKDFGLPVDWHRDPTTGIVVPLVYGKEIDYRNDALVGDIKLVWELGRHQHLVPLAVAYACSGDRCYRDAVTRQIEGWIQANPFGLGIHWCSALEVALRLTSWAVIHGLLALRDGIGGLFTAVTDGQGLERSLFQQAWFVRHFLSRHSSANNHLIGELTGLFAATTVFEIGRQGRQWRSFAKVELEREALRQVYPDGVDREQAFYYHLWVLEYLLFVWLLAARMDQPMSPGFGERLKNMGEFLHAVTPPGGNPPQVGDADDGFVTRFDAEWPREPYDGVLATLELAFPGHAFRTRTGIMPEKAFWYGSIIGRIHGAGTAATEIPRQLPRVFPQGGYALLGTPQRMVLFDAGSLGYASIAAHGHADALSVCIAINSRWWLVDPGTYKYHSCPEWRDYFRGTTAHNTIVVDNRDQSRMGGAFLWLRHARATLSNVVTDAAGWQCASGSHDGYRSIGIVHRRRIRVSPAGDIIEFEDKLAGTGKHDFHLNFHFAPDIHVTPVGSAGEWLAERGRAAHRLRICVDTRWQWKVYRGCESPRLGWYSGSLGIKEPADCLSGFVNTVAPCGHITRIFVEAVPVYGPDTAY